MENFIMGITLGKYNHIVMSYNSWCIWGFEIGEMFVILSFSTQVDQFSDLRDLYAQLPWGDDWNDASLNDVIIYLRGSKLLNIPAEWRPLLPTEL